MLIESIIRRNGGTKINLHGKIYHFQTVGNDPRQVCEVSDPDDLQTMLSIKEGFRVAKTAAVETKPLAEKPTLGLKPSVSVSVAKPEPAKVSAK